MMQQNVSTSEFARLNNVQPETVRRRFCERGSYYGIVPEKRVNGRLTWPARTIHKIERKEQDL